MLRLLLFVSITIFSFSQEPENKNTAARTINISPEQYTTIRLPEKFRDYYVSNNDVLEIIIPKSRNNTTLILRALTSDIFTVNLLVLSPHYEFNFTILGNSYSEYRTLVDLTKEMIFEREKIKNVKNTRIKKEVKKPVRKEKKVFHIQQLLEKKSILESNYSGLAAEKSNVTIGVDKVFYYMDKLIFKFTVINDSAIPYRFNPKINYVEKEEEKKKNIAIIIESKHYYENTKNLVKRSIVESGHKVHVIIVAKKLGVSKDGEFVSFWKELKGSRNIELVFPVEVSSL